MQTGPGNAMMGGGFGNGMMDDGEGFRMSSTHQQVEQTGSLLVGDESIPRSLDGANATAAVMADWNMVQNRRLPSPISESGGEDGGIDSPPGIILDSSYGSRMCQEPSSILSPTMDPLRRDISAMMMEPGMMETEIMPSIEQPHDDANQASSMEVEGATPSPKKGHTRSRHTLNSWTLQPGLKKTFSIGYRADCEKCRMKVPGHFNHIIIS
jgi:hypothetical protein